MEYFRSQPCNQESPPSHLPLPQFVSASYWGWLHPQPLNPPTLQNGSWSGVTNLRVKRSTPPNGILISKMDFSTTKGTPGSPVGATTNFNITRTKRGMCESQVAISSFGPSKNRLGGEATHRQELSPAPATVPNCSLRNTADSSFVPDCQRVREFGQPSGCCRNKTALGRGPRQVKSTFSKRKAKNPIASMERFITEDAGQPIDSRRAFCNCPTANESTNSTFTQSNGSRAKSVGTLTASSTRNRRFGGATVRPKTAWVCCQQTKARSIPGQHLSINPSTSL